METFFVTTPIYYVNDKPHIGHAYTTIACDILARYNKLKNKDVYFLTGTDEHGQKVEKAAKNVSEEPQFFTNKMSENFKDLVGFLNCDANDFIRTTELRHKKAAQNLWNKLLENDQIYIGNYEGWYSVRDEAFYAENELTKLNDRYFSPSGAEVEWLKEESYFFKLSKWQDNLLEHYNKNPSAIAPKSRYNEVISFIKSGLKDLSISRTTFKWGIPVPNNDQHIMYVWLDALTNYITAIGYPDIKSESFQKYWPAVHIVGKDILRFHAVYWPAFLMAAELKPPKRIFAHGWWTNEGEKISKSLGNIIDPYDIVNIYGLDQIRYFLFREVPFGNDGDFSKKAISTRVNADLANNLGNLVQRVCSFINNNCDSIVQNEFNLEHDDQKLFEFSRMKFQNYINFFDNQEIDKAIKEVIELISKANVYCDKLAPWNLKKTDTKRMNEVLSTLVDIIRRSSLMLFPVMPDSIKKIYSILNISEDQINFDYFDQLPKSSYKINTTVPVFPRFETTD